MREKNNNLVSRDNYLKILEKYLNKPFIKVLIGMRRVGKSSIMKLLINKLINNGVKKENIVYINKELLEFDEIQDYKDLYLFVKDRLNENNSQNFIFIDEIQEIDNWEKAVISLFSENLGDIIISGSNSKLLSGQLATLLSGRYVEIPIYPLSFSEFLTFRKKFSNDAKLDLEENLKLYLKYGGLPAIHYLPFEDEIVFQYLSSVLNSILYKDVVEKYRIRDIDTFNRVIKFLFDNIGNFTSAKKISDYLKANKNKVSTDTVLNYINMLESAFLIKRLKRYDLKGKKYLEFNEKIYLNDIGLRNALIGYKEKDINSILENVVLNQLLFRRYKVFVGKVNNYEIDFVAKKNINNLEKTKYIQVCYLLADEKVIDREFRSLMKIKDNYEKIVISLDKFFQKEINGIKHYYLVDFLVN